MDKSWINEPDTFSEAYIKGVESFLQFAKENGMGSDNLIYCPCRSCNNSRFKTLEGVKLDLHMNGFTHNYSDWILHGERVHIFSDSENDISDPIDSNTMNTKSTYLNDDLDEMLDEIGEMRQSNTNFHGVSESFSNLLRNAKRELYLGTLKGFVRNRARPEGSIAEGYVVKESLTFMSMYLSGIKTRFNRRKRNYDGLEDEHTGELSVFSMRVRPFGHIWPEPTLSDEELDKAHQFVLSNCEEVEHYLKTYKAELLGVTLEQASELELRDEGQIKQFPEWFKKHMNLLHHQKVVEATEELWALANGPFRLNTKCYSGCMVNEVRFHTKDRDTRRTTQNSGLVVEGQHKNRMIEFFGHLHRVIELTYLGDRKTVLFQCEWFDTGSKKTIQVDKHFMSIDVRSRWYKNDPFVLPIQVQQVFYINDIKFGKNWQLVQRVQHRHLWELPELDIEDDCNVNKTHAINPLQQFESTGVSQIVEGDILTNLVREDVEPVIIDENTYKEIRHRRHLEDEDVEEMQNEEGYMFENYVDEDEEDYIDEDSDSIELESNDDDLDT
ncbi:hypothetical protein BUALT_Bualt10G0068700 [Buddleja alternifolia]|uniref:Transposase-associated domain-containing protein n=1 Tax=Buddleja alternifolia TaxID=168488 RepID=A0AAV6WXS3_9LAMI|nr:hypothetical protein BUALT_Bualt10G0068700 [Buddleja alternifolia]